VSKETDVVIYGVALLSFCMLVGVFVGDLLGEVMGVQANVGGVGIAMLLLLVLSNLGSREAALSPITEKGIGFWSAMYIPIVVAMAARQNVFSALSGGWMAIVAGVAAVTASFAMIPLLARLGRGGQDDS
jgi:malonate transporter MadL subunit